MQMKKYIASSLREAIDKMKEELGEEAVVLSARVLEEGLNSRSKMFEVVAGLDGAPVKPRTTSPTYEKKPVRPEVIDRKQTNEKPIAPKNNSAELEKALNGLRQKIYQVKNEAATSETAKPSVEKKKPMGGTRKFVLENFRNSLIEKDIMPSLVNTILEQTAKAAEFLKPSDVESAIKSTMASMIPTAGFELKKRKGGKVVALVGPTGVGKTTCIAKIAVISKLLHKLDIGLISLDTYRLGAIDQLKTFAEISGIDFLVAYDEKDLPAMVQKFRKKDIIFLDTAGRSQNNKKLIEETSRTLDSVKVDEILLALSATASTNNLLDIVKKFSVFKFSGVIFTKLDESVAFGNLFNVIVKSKIPVRYITNGQIIPDDIVAAEPEHLANMIYTGAYSEA